MIDRSFLIKKAVFELLERLKKLWSVRIELAIRSTISWSQIWQIYCK